MKIVIATPLYPPDIAEPAPYVKELASRLQAVHNITVVLYGRLPETVEGVTFITIDKQIFLPLRLIKYFVALWRATYKADILYTLNGPSVEITTSVLTLIRKIPMIIYLGDQDANAWVTSKLSLRFIKWFAMHRAVKHINSLPPQHPEILPFNPKPFSDFTAYEQAWKQHIANLQSLFQALKN